MKVLIVGSGGREHALVWKIKQSPRVEEIFVASGNGGTTEIAKNIDIKDDDVKGLVDFAVKNKIDLTIVGPEVPLTLGIVDEFETKKLRIFGPNKVAAKLEGSKAWAKELIQRHGIPCAKSETFANYSEALRHLDDISLPIVLKADGLASGKGVLICKTRKEAKDGIKKIMVEKEFGVSGDKLVVEEFLEGQEVSVLAFTDGKTICPMVPVCDYKRALDNNEGPNTGGMGVYSPPAFYTKELEQEIFEKVLKPTLEVLRQEGVGYKGVLYAGLMLTAEGPKVLEYNCRFGDPETEVILPRLKTDIIDILEAIIDEKLGEVNIDWNNNSCVGVVLASGGYPGQYKTGVQINGLGQINNAIVFHAGTRVEEGKILTAGGRVLCVVSEGKNIKEAWEKVYNEVGKINFEGMHFRSDIGLREL